MERKRHSLPPPQPIKVMNRGEEESLPELSVMQARIEQHIERKASRRNVSILISRNRNDTNATRTPSFMKELDRDNSRLSLNGDIECIPPELRVHDDEKNIIKLPSVHKTETNDETTPQ